MTCDRCGRDNPPKLTFCQDCGQRLNAPTQLAMPASPHPPPSRAAETPPLVFPPREMSQPAELGCSACGASNPHAHRFCVSCGAPLVLAPQHHAPAPMGVLDAPLPIPLQEPRSPRSHIVESARRADEPGVVAALRARLVTIAEDGSEGAPHSLARDQVDLGREEGDIVLSSDPYLSPRHARFIRRGDAWYVQDLGSLNGVFVRLHGSAPVVHGDLLLVGIQVLKFELVNGAEQALGPASQHGTRVFGSPVFPRYARLCQRTVEGVTRNVFYLHKDETTVGRESGDIVFSDDPFLSRRHLSLVRDPANEAFTALDFGSSNGTYLAIRQETRLEHGAQLRLGQHLFRFDLIGITGHGEGARRVA